MSAYEVTLQQGAKDEAAWRRLHSQLYAEPVEVKKERVAARRTGAAQATQQPARGMTLDSVEAMLAGASARDARFGAA